MRCFVEFKGQSARLDYDRERSDFVAKALPHPFLVRKPAAEVEIETTVDDHTKASRGRRR